jgi:hypothetical protein
MIVILLFIVFFFILFEIETLYWSLTESQTQIHKLNNRMFELQGAVKVLMAQKKDEPVKTRTIWVAASKYGSENDVEIEEVEQEQEHEQEQEQEEEIEIEED